MPYTYTHTHTHTHIHTHTHLVQVCERINSYRLDVGVILRERYGE